MSHLYAKSKNGQKVICTGYANEISIIALDINFIYLFVTRHEVHSMNTHTLQHAGRWKQTKQNVQGIEADGITGLQILFATALKTET